MLAIDQSIFGSDDNFIVLVRDEATGQTAAIDAVDGPAIAARLRDLGWGLDLILVTHHHRDHTAGITALKQQFGATVVAPAADAGRIPAVDRGVREGDTVNIGSAIFEVIETPGHTAGHVSFHFPKSRVAFTADTLFALGCGRLFEAPPPVMYDSLKKLADLPPETVVYCGHEYTQANARFALSVDPTNSALKERAKAIDALRASGKPTLPTTLLAEMSTNPFLRWHDKTIRRTLGMEGASDEAVFAEIRKRKDVF